ncbi:MAG: M23 family metallopeptidase [Armatimonadetes bacterium]|nr:M23 family metallopeptidase [Armatimonadota bacterium]
MQQVIAVLCLLVMSVAAVAQAPTVATTTIGVEGAPRQGGVLFVKIEGIEGAEATVRWVNKTFQAVRLPNEPFLRVVLPVPVDARPGTHPLVVGDTRRDVPIRSKWFGHQSIWLPAAMLATYDTPRSKRDDEILIEATRRMVGEMLWRGNFARPAAGYESTPFGIKRLYNGWRKGWHRGVDVAVGDGTPLHAPAAAVVGLVAPGQYTNGNAIVLNHGLGVSSLYLHMSRFAAKTGEKVARGEVFGYSGHSGAGTGPHLHWGMYVWGVPIDPAVFRALPAGWH